MEKPKALTGKTKPTLDRDRPSHGRSLPPIANLRVLSIDVLHCAEMVKRACTLRCLVLSIGFHSLIAAFSCAQGQQSPSQSDTLYHDQVHDLAARILKKAGKAKCHPNNCTVLVENFTIPSGSTSRLGIQLADSLSAEMLSQANGIQMVNRSRLEEYLMHERIPSNLLKDGKAAGWLASQFQANAALIGRIEQHGDHFDLLVDLLNATNEKNRAEEAVDISISDPRDGLASFEPYDTERQNPAVTSAQGSMRVRAGVNGVGVPKCIYCRLPQYTNEGRDAKINGSVVLQVTVTEDGRAADIRVLKGMPFGMSAEAVKSVSAWKFGPATGEDGKPVSVIVPIEVTFRLY